MKENENIILLILLIIHLACNSNTQQEYNICNGNLAYCDMLLINECETLLDNQVFRDSFQIDLTNTSPKNLIEAVVLLDSLTNQTFKHGIQQCDVITFHMDVGMHIRNSWIYGDDELKKDLATFNISHPDHASSFILNTYKVFSREGKVDFLKFVNEGEEGKHMDTLPLNILKLENELNALKGF